jgi:hypothetical protein
MQRNWSVSWAPVASDGTERHKGLRHASLSGHKAKRVGDLSLHQYDMGFCKRLLQEHGPKLAGDYDDLSRALWIAVLTKFVSCFRNSGQGARSLLSEKEVYASDPKALRSFAWILALRNKHIVHDENSFYGASAFASLEQNGDVRKVAAMTYVTRIEPGVVEVMRHLVDLAQEHIRVALADAGKALFAEVQAMSPEERMALPTGTRFSVPSAVDFHCDVGRKR